MGVTGYIASRLLRKPLVVRKFAGDDYRTTLGAVGRAIAEFVLRRSDCYLAQTQDLVARAKMRGIGSVTWYPTSRPLPDGGSDVPEERERCTRFVYVGRVCTEKGMEVLAEASKQLPVEISIDVYGPWADDLNPDTFADCPNVKYRGELRPEEVIPALRRYDASLLPTFYPREGYPGAILESYMAGLPVISTRWLSIPEIVDETVGILVEPRDAESLAQAMLRLVQEPELYQEMCRNTRTKAEFFSSEYWGERFVELCREVATRSSSARAARGRISGSI